MTKGEHTEIDYWKVGNHMYYSGHAIFWIQFQKSMQNSCLFFWDYSTFLYPIQVIVIKREANIRITERKNLLHPIF